MAVFVHLGALDPIAQIATLLAITTPFIVAYFIYRDIYGLLNSLWRPFRIIMFGLVPMYILSMTSLLQDLLGITILPGSIVEYMDHIVMPFTFLVIGYAFLDMRKILNDYGALVKEVKKLK
ncbi:MAG: hypothetical protein NT016_00835 [Candidatus Aenigmarchaeota archaeon]|nr:hypothetical protein [Candidatus Aenigmarchaeota archaeon]